MKTIREEARDLPILAEADVVVAGGGPAGIGAAVAAARAGAKTVLLERYGFLGGMWTAGLVGPILAIAAHEDPRPIVGGIGRELGDRLHRRGGAPTWEEGCRNGSRLPFNAEIMKLVCDELALDAGVEVILHSLVGEVLTRDGRIAALCVESKSGRQAVTGKVFVDATGDADVAARAGAPYTAGRAGDSRFMALGSMFHWGGQRSTTPEEAARGREACARLLDSRQLGLYGAGGGNLDSCYGSPLRSSNVTRFAGNCADVRDLTAGEIQVRRDTHALIDFYRREVPGFESAYLAQLPPNIGVRESRQIVGDYALTGEDVVQARKFPDQVALGSWWIDIHCPLGVGGRGVHFCQQSCRQAPPCPWLEANREAAPAQLYPPKGGYYGIPYRCLVPQKVDNLLVAGRCLSATPQGQGGARVTGTCLAMGEASGLAAARAANAGRAPRAENVAELRAALIKAGAIVD